MAGPPHYFMVRQVVVGGSDRASLPTRHAALKEVEERRPPLELIEVRAFEVKAIADSFLSSYLSGRCLLP
jgi:hypothetical protein